MSHQLLSVCVNMLTLLEAIEMWFSRSIKKCDDDDDDDDNNDHMMMIHMFSLSSQV